MLNVEGLIGGFGSVGIKLVWRLELADKVLVT